MEAQINSISEQNKKEFIEVDPNKTYPESSVKEIFFVVKTAREVGSAPKEILPYDITNTSISLKWKLNPCANDYIVSVSYGHNPG